MRLFSLAICFPKEANDNGMRGKESCEEERRTKKDEWKRSLCKRFGEKDMRIT